MLGFKKRQTVPAKTEIAAALARLQAAGAELAQAPSDPTRREEFRLAHNAVADALADPPARG